jgi:hypothetical protein
MSQTTLHNFGYRDYPDDIRDQLEHIDAEIMRRQGLDYPCASINSLLDEKLMLIKQAERDKKWRTKNRS